MDLIKQNLLMLQHVLQNPIHGTQLVLRGLQPRRHADRAVPDELTGLEPVLHGEV